MSLNIIPPNTLPFTDLDEDTFQLEIFEFNHGPVNFDPDRLTSLYFNPLMVDTNRNIALNSDLDPDINIYADSRRCQYYTEDQFNMMLKLKSHSNSSFSVLHLNIRSLKQNLSNLTDLHNSLDIHFSTRRLLRRSLGLLGEFAVLSA